MKTDFYLEYYGSILRNIAKWRIVEAKLLYVLSDYHGTNRSFNRVISILEKTELIKANRIRGKAKFLSSTKALDDLYKIKAPLVHADSLVHEAIITTVSNKMLEWNKFRGAILPHETNGKVDFYIKNLLPDCVLQGASVTGQYYVALEIELSRKSKTRVSKRIQDYLENGNYDHIFYIFNDWHTFESYKRMLQTFIQSSPKNLADQASVRFVLGYYPNLYSNNFDLGLLEIYHQGQTTSMKAVFGDQKTFATAPQKTVVSPIVVPVKFKTQLSSRNYS